MDAPIVDSGRLARTRGMLEGVEETASDADLVHAAVAGDRRAFSMLFERWFDRSYDVAWNIVRDREVAAEVAQDAFLAAWTGLGSLRDPAAFGGWILRTSRNKALNRLERERRSRPTDVDVAVDLVDRRQRAVDVAEDIVRDEQHDLLWAAAAALGEADASILDLHLRHDLDAAQIAEALDIEPNAAHQRLFRLRKRLEGAIRSHVIWNGGTPRCEELGSLLVGAEIEGFGPAVVKLVSGHVVDCDECDERQRAVLAPASMFGAVPLVVVGFDTRRAAAASLAESGVAIDPDAIGDGGDAGTADATAAGAGADAPPGTAAGARRKLVMAAVALVLLVGGAVTVASLIGDGGEAVDLADATAADAPSDETVVTPAPSGTTTDLGSTTATDVDDTGSPPPPSTESEPTVATTTTAAPPPSPPPGPDTTGSTTTGPAPVVVRFDAVVGGSVPCGGGGGLDLRLVWTTEHADEVTLDGPGTDPAVVHPGSGSLDTCLPRGDGPEWQLTATGSGGFATAHVAR